jgi:transcriptional regulator with XRE-family HTH domain
MLTREELGRRIAEQRGRAGLTQDQLAAGVGLERTAISRIEKGRQGVDTLQLSAIAATLGVHPAIFFAPVSEELLIALLRGGHADEGEIREELAWIEEFLRDYALLRDLTPELEVR